MNKPLKRFTMKKKILFPYRRFLSFVKNDLDTLKEKYDVTSFYVSDNLFSDLIKFFRYTRKSDLVFAYFAGVHAFLGLIFAKIFRKKMIVVAGGYDATSIPELNYGAFASWWRGKLAKYIFEHADLVIACTKYTKKEILERAKPKKLKIIYDGVDINKFYPMGKKKRLATSVGFINRISIKRKGMETFVKSAKYLPDVEFVLVGKHSDDSVNYLRSIASKNVKFPGKLPDEKLIKLYQNSKVYVQVSAHEAPGIALAESMLCCCIPVVTRRAAIPELVGNTGFYVPYDEPEKTAYAIKKALESDEKLGRMARERVKKLLPLDKIKKELLDTVGSVING